MPSRLTRDRSPPGRSGWPLAASAVAGFAAAQPAPPSPPSVVQMPPSKTVRRAASRPSRPRPLARAAGLREGCRAQRRRLRPGRRAAPVRRTRYDVAVIEALDKVTAESLRFEAAGGPAGALQVAWSSP